MRRKDESKARVELVRDLLATARANISEVSADGARDLCDLLDTIGDHMAKTHPKAELRKYVPLVNRVASLRARYEKHGLI